VYGGGGILPDVFVARDTTRDSDYLTELIAQNIFRQFAFHYGDLHNEVKTRLGNAQVFNREFQIDETLLAEFTTFAEGKGVKLDAAGLATFAPRHCHLPQSIYWTSVF
jgi:carboxyl-terminal processing protease